MTRIAAAPRVALPCGCLLGEAPMWDARSGTLFFVDIKAQALWRCWPGSGREPVRLEVGDQVGFVKLTPEPNVVLLGLKHGIARLDLRDGRPEMLLEPEPDQPGNRLNDGGVGPDGSLYFGTMDDSERLPTGSFYHWSEAGLVRFGGHAVVTNGPSVDSLRGRIYTADTTNNHVFRHRLGPDGILGEAELFVTFPAGTGHPDGLTIDAEGCVWVCHFGGSRVTRFSPDGEALLVVELPVSQVTKAAFGGPDLTTLFITTARIGRDLATEPLAGHLFTLDTDIHGLEAELCRMIRL